MLTVIGSLIGFLSSALPSILKIIQDHKDKKHELAILQLQTSCGQLNMDYNLAANELQTQVFQMSQLWNHAFEKTHTWVDAFAASVRPVITYAFFVMYIGLKIYVGTQSLNISDIWTEQDEIVFATLMSFWFGTRTLNGKQYIYKRESKQK